MQQNWSELVDTICNLRGAYQGEFAAIHRAVDVARHYVRDLLFPILLQELDRETLDGAAIEADGLMHDEAIDSTHCPTILALTLTAHALLNGDGEHGASELAAADVEGGCRRVASFVLVEKMRQMEVYGRMVVPFDPWDDDAILLCEELNIDNERAFKRWLGYTVED